MSNIHCIAILIKEPLALKKNYTGSSIVATDFPIFYIFLE